MAITEKPDSGTWTEAYKLGTEPVSFTDSISPEFYEREREAIFRRAWLNVGRVEQVPKVGSYFTRELDVLDASIVVVRGSDRIRAFHNVCRHRGNKLVWTDDPALEQSGTCRQFSCKYHGWRYALDGELVHINQEEDFFGVDKGDYGLVEVTLDVWEGFIFVNLSPSPAQSLREFLGEMAWGMEGYPFEKMTQVYKYRAEVGANWKLFMDTFAEFYHAPILHGNQTADPQIRQMMQQMGARGSCYRLFGPHRVVTSAGSPGTLGTEAPPVLDPPPGAKPVEVAFRAGLQGTWDVPDIGLELADMPPAMNPTRSSQWGLDSFQFFPNFVILVWGASWYLTYHYWPLSADRHIFEGTLYFTPPENAGQRLAQELCAATFKEFALQDASTLEATHRMLKSGVVDKFLLGDEEILCRHLHQVVQDWVNAYGA